MESLNGRGVGNEKPVVARAGIEPGQLVNVRGRMAIVDSTDPTDLTNGQILCRIKYIDDYLPSEDVLIWELERDKELLQSGLVPDIGSSPPTEAGLYNAYLNSVKWSTRLAFPKEDVIFLTGPIRSSVLIHNYQLWPVYKAMLMPSVRLFIADDVGLGKTIEAGLVAQELIAQRGIRRILILCPATLQNQWKDEMAEKFHQAFTVMDRSEVSRIKQLDPNTNPWAFHQKVVVSMDFLKRPEVLEEFEAAANRMAPSGSGRMPWDLIIVDEVHNFAPLPGGRSSERTAMLERVLKNFEHRIFLSATPHNGYHYSYTGLLNLLDPVRFQKKIEPQSEDEAHIKAVFIRRLKEDVNRDDPPKKFELREPPSALRSKPSPPEEKLFQLLGEYDRAIRDLRNVNEQERQALAFIRSIFKKRLLSSPYAFARTWYAHLSKIDGLRIDPGQRDLFGSEKIVRVIRKLEVDSKADIGDDRVREDMERDASSLSGELLSRHWATLGPIAERITQLLSTEMRIGHDHVVREDDKRPLDVPDSKFQALMSWLREVLGFDGKGIATEERAIIFTEYRDTQDYLLKRMLDAGVPRGSILIVNGGSDPGQIEGVKEAFNDPRHSSRILLATDAAREGLNLQQTCRYVLHHDLPWNPLRIDQRVGRVDRHGQTRKVRTWHHVLDTIYEYEFLSHIVHKVEEARSDLGSLSPILEESIESIFISDAGQPNPAETLKDVDELVSHDISTMGGKRTDYTEMKLGLDRAMDILEYSEDELRQTVDSALRLDGGALNETSEKGIYSIRFPQTWAHVEGSLRQPVTTAMLKATFQRSTFLRTENGMQKWDERKDLVLLSLGHPVVRHAIERLRRHLWQSRGGSRGGITRWSIDRPPEECDRAVVTLLKMARNARGEVVKEEAEQHLYDSRTKSLSPVTMSARPSSTSQTPPPPWHSELLAALEADSEERKRTFAAQVKEELRDHLEKDIQDYNDWKMRSVRMLEEATRDAVQTNLDNLDKEIRRLENEKKQRRLDPIIDVKIRRDLEQKKLERKELEERLSAGKLAELKAHIEYEADRFINEIFPSRYTLGHVDLIVAGILFTGGD